MVKPGAKNSPDCDATFFFKKKKRRWLLVTWAPMPATINRRGRQPSFNEAVKRKKKLGIKAIANHKEVMPMAEQAGTKMVY